MSVPVVLLTGFLGSGKTTFINWLIKTHPEIKISLILNEFGDVPIESAFIEKDGITMTELKNGCMCCVAKGDIPRVVKYILETTPQTQYLLVEASGLSDPAPVYASLTSPELSPLIHLDVNLCLVDALNFEATRQKFPIVMSQVGDADIILLSKVREAGAEKVAAIKQVLINNIGTIKIVEINENLSPALFLDPQTMRDTSYEVRERNSPSHHHEHEEVTELYFQTTKLIDMNAFNQTLQALPPTLVRAKGIINTAEGKKLLFQLVGNRSNVYQDAWKEGEPHQTALIFIGTDFDREALEQQLTTCAH